MEFESAEWVALTPGERAEALSFVPEVFDRSLGPAFQACVAAAAEANEGADFNLGG